MQSFVHKMYPDEYTLHLPDKEVLFKTGIVDSVIIPVDNETFVNYKSSISIMQQTMMVASSVKHKDELVNIDLIKDAILSCKGSIAKIIYIAMSMLFMTNKDFNTKINFNSLKKEHEIKNIDNTVEYLWLYNASLLIIKMFSFYAPKNIEGW